MSGIIDQSHGENWTAYQGDCVEVLRHLPDRSVDFACYSPPFASLYTYSSSERDMGNVRSYAEFFEHYDYLARELMRLIKPGRLVAYHCMLLPTSKERDGYIGLRDFRGDLIRAHQRAGFIHHSEHVIWKDPVTAMQRTKAIGLLHKQLKKDSSLSRAGVPDYIIAMRTPGVNAERIGHTAEEMPVSLWQRWASPVWMDIDPNDTLQRESAREHADERHIAPIQLEVARRCVRLWSNPGDVVLSPFGGIGSEGYVALQEKRRALIVELKRSYFEQAVRNLRDASGEQQADLFGEGAA